MVNEKGTSVMRIIFIILSILFLILSVGPNLSAQEAIPNSSRLGLLNWGNNPANGQPWTIADLSELAKARTLSPVGKEVRNILRSAHNELDKAGAVEPIERIEMEGVLPTESRYQRSSKTVRILPTMIAWAFCTRLEAAEPAGQKCKTALFEGLFGKDGNRGWLGIYKPTGNPIGESNLLPLIQAIDIAGPLLTKTQAEKTRLFLKTIIGQGDRFFAAKKSGTSSRVNNHNTWRLTVRAAAAKVLNDQTLLSETRGLFAQQMADDLREPSGWKSDPACPNNAGELRYGGYDFRQRDALHYHVYNLEAFVFAATFTPDVLDQTGHKAINDALDFLRPYFTGQKVHREFVCSTVHFDRQRSDAGIEEYSANPWKPERARKLLRDARPVFPEIVPWTTNIVDENYSPVLKLSAALHGEGR
jgi:hypothetical protein